MNMGAAQRNEHFALQDYGPNVYVMLVPAGSYTLVFCEVSSYYLVGSVELIHILGDANICGHCPKGWHQSEMLVCV